MDMQIIREARRKRGLTQAELAEAIHVDQSTVSAWEAGKKIPRSDRLARLARVLGIDPKALLRKLATR